MKDKREVVTSALVLQERIEKNRQQ